MRTLLGAVATAALLAAAPGFTAPPPASAFGRIPAVVDAAISPNGQRMAILGGMSDQRIVSIATIDQQGLPILQLGEIETTSIFWADDDYAVATIAVWQDAGVRLAYRIERHVAIDGQARAVSRFFDNGKTSAYLVGGQPILGVTRTGPTRILISDLADSSGADGTLDTRMKRKGVDNPAVRAVWAIDPANGRGKLLEKGDQDTVSWTMDSMGEARVRIDRDALNHRMAYFGRAKGVRGWTQLWAETPSDDATVYHGYSEPDDAVILQQNGKLVRRKLVDGGVETISDLAPGLWLRWDRHARTPVGIGGGAERTEMRWLDPELGAAHGLLGRAFKGQSVSLVDWSKDRGRFLVRVSSPGAPGVWHLYDKARKEISPMGEEYPELKGAALGTTRWTTYRARDGLEIPAYVTRPPGVASSAKLPLVVLPHGGPHSRDTFDFDYLVQFLATRGYVVLQPQFRGSTGFGRAFRDAGQGEWGGKIQTDLLDGVAALAAAGEIDPARVCIVGASFGGYSALAGATLHPDAYRCAASIAGVSDLGALLQDESRLFGRETASYGDLREELGVADAGKIAATSPARHARNIKAPILLIHGDRDTVVLPSQSKLMADRLKEAGKVYEHIELPGENHYLTKSAMRTRMLEALEAFLAKHLPVS